MLASFRPLFAIGLILGLGLLTSACSLQLPGGNSDEPLFKEDYKSAP